MGRLAAQREQQLRRPMETDRQQMETDGRIEQRLRPMPAQGKSKAIGKQGRSAYKGLDRGLSRS